jgi:hypothetical protein
MTLGRRFWLLMAVGLGLTGCRAAGTGSLSLHPRPGLTQTSFDLDEFIAEHNRNAERIQSLKAQPSIGVAMGRRLRFHVNGHLALERPRNFKLEVTHQAVPKADIGSNNEEFWYWVVNEEAENKAIYWCKYSDVASSNLPITFQPDWIIDALGLKPITREEAARIQVHKGLKSGTTLLAFPVVRDQGEPYSREMVVSNANRRIEKLVIYSEKPRAPLAEAVPSDYQSYPGGAKGPDSRTCYLPQKLRLDWKREQLILDVALGKDVDINRLDPSMSAELFTEPEIPGYTRRNLADLSRRARPDRRTTTRQTIPPPESRNGVQLGRPSPMKEDEPAGPDIGSRPPRRAREVDEPPLSTLDDLVGAPVSRPPNSGPSQASRFSSTPDAGATIER